jgi:hypothetical protein
MSNLHSNPDLLALSEQQVLAHSKDQQEAFWLTLVAERFALKKDAFVVLESPEAGKEEQGKNTSKEVTAPTSSSVAAWSGEDAAFYPFAEIFNGWSLPARHRRFFISHNKYMGLAPADSEEEDLICVLFGCPLPVVLRKAGDHYIYIGEAYFHWWMVGKAIALFEQGQLLAQDFDIH